MRWRLGAYRGKWCVIVRPDGKRRRLSTGFDATTENREAAERTAPHLVRQLTVPVGNTIADIWKAYMAESTAIDQTRLHDAWKAAQWTFAPLEPSDVTKGVCVSYAHSRRKEGRSDGTIRKEISSVRAAVNWHDEQNTAKWWLPPAPPPKERWMTRDEMHALLEASRDTYHLFVFLHLALGTAGRKEALFQMKWIQVRWAEDRIFLGFKPGGKKRPTVPMTKTLRAVLEQAQAVARTDHVIEYADRPVKSIRTSLARACKIAGLEGVTPHVLRHSAAVWMRMDDVSIEKLSAYMGHSDTRVTERVYAKYGPDYLDGATDALEL